MPAKRRIVSTLMPASFGVHGPGEMTMRSGAIESMSSSADLVVAEDLDLRAQLAEVLVEVVGEAVVVIDQQQHQ